MAMCGFEEEREALKASIARAFEGVEHPGDYAIQACDMLDDMDMEGFDNRTWEGGWRGLPGEFIERRYDELSSFSPDAYRFYLPAYLCYALDAFHDATSLVLPWLLYNLDPEFGPSDLRHRFYTRTQFVTAKQRRVVRDFLDFVLRYSDDDEFSTLTQRALKQYWGRDS